MKLKPNDPARILLLDGVASIPDPEIYNPNCYICRDSEFARMGLPLCYKCYLCGAHVPADDTVCDNGHDQLLERIIHE